MVQLICFNVWGLGHTGDPLRPILERELSSKMTVGNDHVWLDSGTLKAVLFVTSTQSFLKTIKVIFRCVVSRL